mmetsp:Transcript_39936/g.39508  ORF Transcript_39936/g.39508 Transcript_39936/m.39508 type:complete len:275 (+) Transcript_39936:326-1150(+)
MKMAVIFGVAQMSLGILMKAFNSLYFGRTVEFFFEFIPQIILLWVLFGFMNVLIIVKWLADWQGRTDRAPGIISVMINMFLSQGAVDEGVDPLLFNENTQQIISIVLLLIAFICVPIMLLVKPLWYRCKVGKNLTKSKGKKKKYNKLSEEDKEDSVQTIEQLDDGRSSTATLKKEPLDMDEIIRQQGGDDHPHAFSEVFIHQLIETIEFVLGTISNTASYLRLWALSLAHSQLADVFFEKLLNTMALEPARWYMLFLLFPIFFSFTFFVLMLMD